MVEDGLIDIDGPCKCIGFVDMENRAVVYYESGVFEEFPNLADMDKDESFRSKEIEWVYIYGLADPETRVIRYIGKSIKPLARLSSHFNDKSSCHRTNWIRSIFSKGLKPVIGILDRMHPTENWQDCEKKWIKFARDNEWPLVNETDGGEGVVNLSKAAREKMSKRFKGKPLSEEHRRKVGRKGRKHSDSTKAKMSRAHKGRIFTDEWKEKISKAMTGKRNKGKITVEQAKDIIAKVKEGIPRPQIASEYGINKRTVWLIISGRWCPTTIGKDMNNNASE